MTFELIRPFKESRVLFRFKFGPDEIYATTWKTPQTFQGQTYESEPGIEVNMPKQPGGLDEEYLTMELPLTRSKVHSQLYSMAVQLASPRAVPKLEVEIYMLVVDGIEQRLIYLYEGTLERARANPDGRDGIVSLEFATELRSGLDTISLGRRCDPECDAVFGGTGCGNPNGFGLTQFQPSEYYPNQFAVPRSAWCVCTFDADNPRKVSLEMDPATYPAASPSQRLDTISGQPPGWWIGSFLKYRGVSIPIQSWSQSSVEFGLSRLPPKSWNGAVVFLQLDCNRTVDACRLRFGGVDDFFNGLGYGIPAYNPAIDIPNEST